MDACVTDTWETFKGYTPYILAILALTIWFYQKGNEVKANEAKTLWLELNKLENIYINLKNQPKDHKLNEKNFYDGVDEWKELNLNKMDLAKNLLDGHFNTINIRTLKDHLDHHDFNKMVKNIRTDGQSISDRVNKEEVINSINKLKSELIPFIKYKFFKSV